MRNEAVALLFAVLFALSALHKVQSFHTSHRKFGPLVQRRCDFPAKDDEYDRVLVILALSSSKLPSELQQLEREDYPWYSHPKIGRDRSHVRKRYNNISDVIDRYHQDQQSERDYKDEGGNKDDRANVISNSKFILISSKGMWHRKSTSSSSIASPLYLTVGQLDRIIEGLKSTDISENDDSLSKSSEPLVAWVGKYENEEFWVVNVHDEKGTDESEKIEPKALLESTQLDLELSGSNENNFRLECKPLREFGDSLQESYDAGILATANGLVEFHKSHLYCSYCGGPTKVTKAGASRTCIKEGCGKTIYPRIDSATIMLVTSPCEKYALLGRKRSWPNGRYSTLAGFCEVGETLEECCRRETYEESGVLIDPDSIRFVASQPWPFPRSLMVGFRAKAMALPSSLPEIFVDTNEMEDICWFEKDFVKDSLMLNGSTALTFQPSKEESKFHVPGKASLARLLLTEWVDEKKVE